MNTRHMESFIKVAECGSITKAASLLYISAPSLWQQMNLLEKEVGCPLLSRSGRGVTLTKAGQYFYVSAKEMCAKLYDTIEETKRISDSSRTLKVGYFDVEDIYLLQEFIRDNPDVNLEITALEWKGIDSVCRDLQSGKIDISFSETVNDASSYGCRFIPLKKDRLCAGVLGRHPLAAMKEVTYSDLAKYDVISYSYDGPVSRQLAKSGINYRLVEDDRAKIMEMCYRGSVFMAEEVYLRKEYPLKAVPVAPEISIDYGILYGTDSSNTVLKKYLEYIGAGQIQCLHGTEK